MKRLIIAIVVILLLAGATGAIMASVRAIDRSDEYITYLDKKYGW